MQNVAYAELGAIGTEFKLHGVWLVRKATLITDFRLGTVKV